MGEEDRGCMHYGYTTAQRAYGDLGNEGMNKPSGRERESERAEEAQGSRQIT